MLTLKELKDLYRNPFVWPGGYGKYLITTDGGCLCHDCVEAEYREIVQALINNDRNGWCPDAVDVNWESRIYCDNCGDEIEPEYGYADGDEDEQPTHGNDPDTIAEKKQMGFTDK